MRRALLPLALVSRKLRPLACQVYYESNALTPKTKARFRTGLRRRELNALPHPGLEVGHWIRKLEIRLEVELWRSANLLEEVLVAGDYYLSVLLIPNEFHPHYDPRLPAWQRCFPYLDELKIVLVDPTECEVEGHALAQFAWLDRFHVDVKAKKVDVVVEGFGHIDHSQSRELGVLQKKGHCRCAGRVQEIFTGLLQRHAAGDRNSIAYLTRPQ
ncbi:hypothetical protein K458DRAFT_402671 [Lentithecium fluviatile CBS 122367]|uniref:Uncharacterized protein n=1 Tax=Lentithecium fluviatile CBS 122367 TaxID=1168545 RepID=A0A6G1J6L9_9PLEO|nr:hypothetical protein K458DRAFT_402671 [Lentithecium fluviatile CBS 122367]